MKKHRMGCVSIGYQQQENVLYAPVRNCVVISLEEIGTGTNSSGQYNKSQPSTPPSPEIGVFNLKRTTKEKQYKIYKGRKDVRKRASKNSSVVSRQLVPTRAYQSAKSRKSPFCRRY
jgi:hypothetical protein